MTKVAPKGGEDLLASAEERVEERRGDGDVRRDREAAAEASPQG